jgi:predicted enzyme related to lactoylglutathione lyase
MEISRFIIFTPDVKRLADFYASTFGLSAVGDASEEWTELNAGGCKIAFHKISEQETNRDGWTKLVFGSTDVAGEKERLERSGIKMSDVVRFGEIELCDGRDPDGNYFQISSRGM